MYAALPFLLFLDKCRRGGRSSESETNSLEESANYLASQGPPTKLKTTDKLS